MACDITLNGITRDCFGNRGGILQAWLAPQDEVTVTVDEATHYVDAITLGTATPFKKYEVNPFSSGFTGTVSVDNPNGIVSNSTALTMMFARMTPEKQIELKELSKNAVVALVQDANKIWWFMGFDEPLYITDGTQYETGVDRTDYNGYTIILTDYSIDPIYAVPSDIAEGAINPATPETLAAPMSASVQESEVKTKSRSSSKTSE